MAERPGIKTQTRKQPGIPARIRKDVWYKLDLSAIVYPTLQRRDFSSVYRLSVVLKEEIKPEVLQQALDMTLPRFPTYKAAIRKGLFWRYLEPNDRPGPFVQEDVRNPCQPMYFKANNRYLVRVYYFRNRIALEAHHSLGDGTGGMCVLMTLTATYLRLLGHREIQNGGFVLDIGEAPNEGEERILIDSPKIATFDLKPEMSAYEVTERAVEEIKSGKYDVMILNFANGDMVGHTGVMDAAVKAVKVIDECVQKVVDAILSVGGKALITADHGNCDYMYEPDGTPFTAHTTNPVPLIAVGDDSICFLENNGKLCDIAPTMLDMMGLPKPAEMTGHTLIRRKFVK